MALLGDFRHSPKDRQSIHERVECGYTSFNADGRRYLQLETYGSTARKIPGKVSQSVQLDYQAASTLHRLLEETFPELRSGNSDRRPEPF